MTIWWSCGVAEARCTTELCSGGRVGAFIMQDQAATTPAPLNTTTAPAPTTPSTIVLTHHKDPGTFCGTDEVDVDDWIADYERTSEIHRWDP